MSHVFVSYVRNNKTKVQHLCDDLVKNGVQVWLDQKDITPGTDWWQAIRKAIQEGAFFIACFSKRYTERKKAYMNEELNLAIDELRKRVTGRTWFIPVKLDRCEIPDMDIGMGKTLRNLQYIELYKDWSFGIQRVLDVIQPELDIPASRGTQYYKQTEPHTDGKQPSDNRIIEVEPFFWFAQLLVASTTSNMEIAYRELEKHAISLSIEVKRSELPVGHLPPSNLTKLKDVVASKHGETTANIFLLGYIIALLPFSFNSADALREGKATIEAMVLKVFSTEILVVVTEFLSELPCEIPDFAEKVESLKVSLQAIFDKSES